MTIHCSGSADYSTKLFLFSRLQHYTVPVQQSMTHNVPIKPNKTLHCPCSAKYDATLFLFSIPPFPPEIRFNGEQEAAAALPGFLASGTETDCTQHDDSCTQHDDSCTQHDDSCTLHDDICTLSSVRPVGGDG